MLSQCCAVRRDDDDNGGRGKPGNSCARFLWRATPERPSSGLPTLVSVQKKQDEKRRGVLKKSRDFSVLVGLLRMLALDRQ